MFRSTYEREGAEMRSIVADDCTEADIPEPGDEAFIAPVVGDENEEEFIVQSVTRRRLPGRRQALEALVMLEWAERN